MTLAGTLSTPADYLPRKGERHDCGDGVMRTASEIALITGCGVSAVHARIANGWTGADLLREKRTKLYDCGKERLSIRQIAERAGVSEASIRSRIARGVRGRNLLLKGGDRWEPAAPRHPSMVLACRLADAFPDQLPTTAEIRRLQPMSPQSAERWRNALRAAREAA